MIDVVVAIALAASTPSGDGGSGRSMGEVGITYLDWRPALWISLPLGLAVGTAAWWRRRRPMLFVLAALAGWVVLSAYVAVMVAQYTLARQMASQRTRSQHAARIGVLAGTVLVVGIPIWRAAGADAATSIAAVFCGLPVLLGLYVGAQSELIARMRQRAERAEREQHQRVLQARSAERAQIARDMHDVVTHRVSLMVLHATALEVARDQDATAIGTRIGVIGRETLDELRSLVEVLRSDGDNTAPLAPQPTLADLDDLADASRRLGMPVTLELVDDCDTALPALVEHAAYRVVQEALTNVHKHAATAPTHVRVHHTHDALHLRVTNRRAPNGGRAELPAGGHGLLGVAERVRLVGGELTARPTAEGGFDITAEVPLTRQHTP
ncbi:histidine kinase [Actinomadura sp. 3N407]|uniref:histidine kinase n=1 Tax=Actinomadura sp. 3N407 TaxID=3457423 RepID=UPI003FCE90F5